MSGLMRLRPEYFGFLLNFRTYPVFLKKTEFLLDAIDTNRTTERISDSYDPE